MTLYELITRIQAIVPDAGFSVWDSEIPYPPEADPSTTREVRFELTVCWPVAHPSPCPSEEELSQVTL